MVSVLVVDDHDLMRSGLVGMLAKTPGISVVAEAANGFDAVSRALELKPDIVLMDVGMPGMDGAAATRNIRRQWSEARIIAVTACDDEASARQMIKAGALGYVTKSSDIEAVLTAIRRALRGERYLSGELGDRLDPSRFPVCGPFEDLSGRELEITKQVVAGRKVQEIAKKLYITSQTVHTYRYRIFEKLGVHSDVELTRMAMQHGLIKDH